MTRTPHILAWLVAAVIAAGSRAQPDPEKQRLAGKYAQESAEAFGRGDYDKAEDLLHRQLVVQPGNFVVLYNLACCRAMRGDAAGGSAFLVRAVEHGFTDVRHLRRDPTLAGLREDETYKRILAAWPRIAADRLEANLKAIREGLSKGYVESRDERLRVAYLSAFDARATAAAIDELGRVAKWADELAMGGVYDEKELADDAWVVVVLPTRADFERWAESVYGPGAVRGMSMIAGSYEHDPKRLVSMDLGATLRHEFMHLLHWRDMTRRGQQHPIWIMEGLCSLAEDFDAGPDGAMTPATSWRTNTVKRIERIGRLTPIADLAKMPQAKFTGTRPLANYAMARAFFLYLSQRGVLREWYGAYVAGYGEDPSGLKALEAVLGMPAKEIDAEFKAWVRALEAVPEQVKPGAASLGVEVEAGAGEGPLVRMVERRSDRAMPAIRMGDVLTAIDGKPVRDLAELVRVLGGYRPGDTVTVSYRRGRLYGDAAVVLVKR